MEDNEDVVVNTVCLPEQGVGTSIGSVRGGILIGVPLAGGKQTILELQWIELVSTTIKDNRRRKKYVPNKQVYEDNNCLKNPLIS